MKLIVQPDEGIAPLLTAVKRATRTLDIVIFRFDLAELEDALAAVKREVVVRALIAHANKGGEGSLRKLELDHRREAGDQPRASPSRPIDSVCLPARCRRRYRMSHWSRITAGTILALLACSWSPVRADTAAARFVGRPTFSEGKALGYFVWKDGDTWKLRWTTFGAEHRFSGRVTVEGGDVQSLKRIDVDTERRVIARGRAPRVVRGPRGRVRGVAGGRPAVVASREEDRIEQETEHLIRFVTRTDDDIDGFDFKVTPGTTALRLVLEIDGTPRPAEVEVGRDNVKPMESPLVVNLR